MKKIFNLWILSSFILFMIFSLHATDFPDPITQTDEEKSTTRIINEPVFEEQFDYIYESHPKLNEFPQFKRIKPFLRKIDYVDYDFMAEVMERLFLAAPQLNEVSSNLYERLCKNKELEKLREPQRIDLLNAFLNHQRCHSFIQGKDDLLTFYTTYKKTSACFVSLSDYADLTWRWMFCTLATTRYSYQPIPSDTPQLEFRARDE